MNLKKRKDKDARPVSREQEKEEAVRKKARRGC